MGKILLWFMLSVTFVDFMVDGVYGESSDAVRKHVQDVLRNSDKLFKIEHISKKSDISLPMESNSKDKDSKEQAGFASTNLPENANGGEQTSSKIIDHVGIDTKNNPKTSPFTQPNKVLKHIDSNSSANSPSMDYIKSKSDSKSKAKDPTLLQKGNKISKKTKEQTSEQAKSAMENPKETNLKKVNYPEGEKKIMPEPVEKPPTKYKPKHPSTDEEMQKKNTESSESNSSSSNSSSAEHIKQKDEIKKSDSKNKDNTVLQRGNDIDDGLHPKIVERKQKNPSNKSNTAGTKTIHKLHNSETKSQTKSSDSINSSSKTKTQPLRTEKEQEKSANLDKADTITQPKKESKLLDPKSKISGETQNGKLQTKRAKKLLVTFFHSELDDDEHDGVKKTHVTKENEHGEETHEKKTHHFENIGPQDQETTLAEISTPVEKENKHGEETRAKKTHVPKEHEHGDESSRVSSSTHGQETTLTEISTHGVKGNIHGEGAHEKKTQVTKEHETNDGSSQVDQGTSELSDKLHKRTGFQLQPQLTNPNNRVIIKTLPSGPNADAPQHIRISKPTQVLFKPVHKYYPAIHRYMTKPIHRYLKKPVDLNGVVNQPLEGQDFTEASLPQVKEYTAPTAREHSVGIPQVFANKITPQRLVPGGLMGQQRIVGSPLEVKQYVSPPGRGQHVGIPQVFQPNGAQQEENSGGLVNDQAVIQTKLYAGRPRVVPSNMVPGGLVHGNHFIQGAARHMGPVRIFTQLQPRIQPVLNHPNRLSPTGFGPCSTNPCKNSGVCSTVNNQAVCICRPEYRGIFCELINKCHPNPCRNSGSCTEIERDFECSCKKGYRGKRCEVENKCEPNPCVNGGTCSEIEDDYVCTCRVGFFGHSCEAESKCNPINPCKNGATCQEARDTYKCFCRDGFSGFNCEASARRNLCQPNPCQNGGFCTISGTSTGNYTCSCSNGWKGSTCVEKVDTWGNSPGPTICESVNPCMFGGKCTPVSYYDYTCTCPHGRGGAHCEQDHPKFVSSCSHCHPFARCLDGQCSCKKGYVGDGKKCEAVKQFCHPNPCYNGGTCRQSTNQKRALYSAKPWWCDCPPGYKGLNCQDMDLCLMRLCQNGGSCLSSQGQTKCLCPPAYRGKYCQEKNVCHGNPCRNGGLCKAVEGVATCSCRPEFEGSYCQHWKCSKCDRHADCDRGTCVCKKDYAGDGMTCRHLIASSAKDVPPNLPADTPTTLPPPPPPPPPPLSHDHKFCDPNPCANGATCLEAQDTYYCECPENKHGKQCDETPKVIADLCSKCDIDATCKDGRCVCNEGFNGDGFTCRKSTPTVTVSTPHKTDSSCDFCPENGQCLDNVCVCPPGFQMSKRSCVAIDVSRIIVKAVAKTLPPGIQFVGSTRNRLPIGQWKETSVVNEYQSLGCWADTKEWRKPVMRAVQSMEGLHPFLNDDYQKRKDPITKCAKAAKAYGYKVFAVQNGGQCFSDTNARKTYTTYGPSVQCRFGVGGALANDVYQLP